jgi:hypothetical protein
MNLEQARTGLETVMDSIKILRLYLPEMAAKNNENIRSVA